MSVKKTSALLTFISALSLALAILFVGGHHYAAVARAAPAAQPQPQAQSAEGFGLAGGCQIGSNFIPLEGSCGPKTDVTSCQYSQEICKGDPNGVGSCTAGRHDEPSGTVCQPGAGCQAPSKCNGSGTCQPGAIVNCSTRDKVIEGVVCERWGCTAQPGGECAIIETVPKTDATCSMTTDPNPPVCGQKYTERYTTLTPAKCGGVKCPVDKEVDGPPCPTCSCSYSSNFTMHWSFYGPWCSTLCAAINSQVYDIPTSNTCRCAGVPLSVCPEKVTVAVPDLSWSANDYMWAPVDGAPPSCKPDVKLPTSCFWPDLGTRELGFYLDSSHLNARGSGVPGRITYDVSVPSYMLPLGESIFTATFTPDDLSLYQVSTCTTSVFVEPKKTGCTVTANNGSFGSGATGLVSVRGYDAKFSFITVNGSYTYTIDGKTPSADLILDAGKTYPVVASFTPSEWGYAGSTCTGSITIDASSAICSVDSATRPYNTVLSQPLGFVCRVGGTIVTSGITGGTVADPPAQNAAPGDYPVGFSANPTSTNYAIQIVPGNVTVTAVDSSCQIPSQTVQSGNPVSFGGVGYIAGTTTPLGGTFVYKQGGTIVTDGSTFPVGTHAITADFTPGNVGYKPSQCGGTITVTEAPLKATYCTVSAGALTYGTGVTFSTGGYDNTTRTAVGGTFQYTVGGLPFTPGSTLPAKSGYVVTATFIPSLGGYSGSTCSGVFNVSPKLINVWVNSASVGYGQSIPIFTKADFTVDPLVSPDTKDGLFGTRVPTTTATMGALANTTYPITVAPPSNSNYTFKVNNGTLSITQALSSCTLTGLTGQSVDLGTVIDFGGRGYINGTTTPLNGTFDFKEGTAVVYDLTALPLGTHSIVGTFTPDNPNYKFSTCSGSVVVKSPSQKTTYCSLTVSDVTYGSGAVFSGQGFDLATGAAVGGTFTYSIDSTTVNSGVLLDAKKDYLVTAYFTPSSPGYASSSCQNSFTVNKRPAECTAGSAIRDFNTVLAQPPGFKCEVVNATTGARSLISVTGGAVTAPPAQDAVPGNYPITFSPNPTSTNYALTFVPGNVQVKSVGSSCSLSGLTGQSVTLGTPVFFGARGYVAGTTTPLAGTWLFKEGATVVTSGSTTFTQGTHSITATFTPSSAGYTPSECTGSFVITAPALTNTTCTVTVSSVNYGTPLSIGATARDGSGNTVNGEWTYTVNGAVVNNGAIINAGSDYKLIATFTPDMGTYSGTSCYTLFTVSKPIAKCTAGSATRDYNTTLPSPLSFVCTVGSTVVSSGITGGTLSAPPAQNAPPTTYPITFVAVPTATNYIITTENGLVTVNQLGSRCELTGLTGQTVTYGSNVDTLPRGYIGATATSLTGTFLFKDGATDLPNGTNGVFQAGTVLPVGLHTISASFQPQDGVGYGTSSCNGTVTVAGCTANAQCKVDDGNACTSNACCTGVGGCTVGSTLIPVGHCYNRPITGPVGAITPSLQLICPANGSQFGQLKFTWPDNGGCIDPASSAYSFLIIASTISPPSFTPTPAPTDVLYTTDTRARCSGGNCEVIRNAPASKFKSGTTIYGAVSIGTNGVWTSNTGNTQTTSTCAWCGDGLISGGEGCDGTTFPAGKTAASGYRCNACTLEWCGDLIRNGSEECDGNGPGLPQCTSTCTITGKATSCTVSPTPVTFGSGAAFNGVGKIGTTSTTLPGTFVYTLTAGASSFIAKDGDILDAKTYAVSAKFIPSDPTYAGSTCTGSLTVSPKAATCTGENKERVYNTANPSIGYTCESGGVNINGKLSVGTFKSTDYPAVTALVSASPYPITFDLKPSHPNYTVTYTNGSIKVNKATATCSIGSPTITAGTPITHAMFNPTMIPNGTMTYRNETLNTVLTDGSTPSAGTYSIKASLAPTDSSNYLGADCIGVLTVKKPVMCNTVPLKLPTSTTFNEAFVKSGFTVTADVILGGTWTFTVGGAPILYAPRPTGAITVVGTFQPSNGGYSPVTCSTTITPVQCTSSTVAQDCTADDGNACTDNACTALGQCYNKYKGIVGTLSPQVTLTCPNTFTMTFNNVLKCVDPALSPLYRVGVDSLASVVFNSNTGNLVNGSSNVVGCTGSTCTYTNSSLASSLFYSGKTLYGGVAAFEGSTIKQQANQAASGSCTDPSTGGGGTNQCPADGSACGANCTRAPYPDCSWSCSGYCSTNAITYYTADGECLIATSWGPSASCCPNQGCDIRSHGYGDQYDYEWFKMVPLVSACPSQKGTMLGDDIRCPTCKCGNTSDCQLTGPDGESQDLKLLPAKPKYGHLDGETEVDDRCHCVPDPNQCPPGYTLLMPSFNVHYTSMAAKGLLAGTTCP